MIIEPINSKVYRVDLSDGEVQEISDLLPNMGDVGIEIWEGQNTLEKDTLWWLLCECNKTNYHTTTSLEVVKTLKKHLYPEE